MNDNINYAVVLLMFHMGKVLTISRRDNKKDLGLPGGKVEPGETRRQAIIREVYEETGMAITDPLPIYSIGTEGWHTMYYVASPIELNPTTQGEGVVSWQWPEALLGPECSFRDSIKILFDALGVQYGR